MEGLVACNKCLQVAGLTQDASVQQCFVCKTVYMVFEVKYTVIVWFWCRTTLQEVLTQQWVLKLLEAVHHYFMLSWA